MPPSKRLKLDGPQSQDTLAAVVAVGSESPQLLGLPHVLQLFMDYLLGLYNIELVTKAGLHCIVNWLLSRCDASKLPKPCRYLRFLHGVTEAATQGNIALLEAWFAHFPDVCDGAIQSIYCNAVCRGHVNILEWPYTRTLLGENEATSTMITNLSYWRPAVVHWLVSHFLKLRLPISVDDAVERSNVQGKMEFLKWLWSRK